jgi:hypothetical protein
MKRLDIVQLTIIIIGLLIGYKILEFIPNLLFSLYTWFSQGLWGGEIMTGFLASLIVYGFYFLTMLLCFKKSKQLSAWICNTTKLETSVSVSLDRTELLFVFFIAFGIYGLVNTLPSLLTQGFFKIKSHNAFATDYILTNTDTADIARLCIKTILYFILVIYARVFAEFFASKINNTEPEDEIAQPAE